MSDFKTISQTAGLLLLLLLIQIAVIPFISVGSVQPDLVLIGIVFIAVRYGQFPALFYGFGIGLLYDLFVGDVVGLSSLSKTIAAFSAGYFYSDEKAESTITSSRFIGITALTAFIHNAIYIFAYFRDITTDIVKVLLLHGAGSMLYTVILSALPVLFLANKRRKVKV
jgi:rod shape-determining protein MreD